MCVCCEGPGFSGEAGASRELTTLPTTPLGSHFNTESHGRVDLPADEKPEAQGKEGPGPQPPHSLPTGLVPVTRGSIQVLSQSLRDPGVLLTHFPVQLAAMFI